MKLSETAYKLISTLIKRELNKIDAVPEERRFKEDKRYKKELESAWKELDA